MRGGALGRLSQIAAGQCHRPGIEHCFQMRMIDLVEQRFVRFDGDPHVVMILQAERDTVLGRKIGRRARASTHFRQSL